MVICHACTRSVPQYESRPLRDSLSWSRRSPNVNTIFVQNLTTLKFSRSSDIHVIGVKTGNMKNDVGGKSPILAYTTCTWPLIVGGDPSEFRRDLWHRKSRVFVCLYLRDVIFSQFDKTPTCDRRTDRHTNTWRQHILRYCSVAR